MNMRKERGGSERMSQLERIEREKLEKRTLSGWESVQNVVLRMKRNRCDRELAQVAEAYIFHLKPASRFASGL
jgi:hypothetical protein